MSHRPFLLGSTALVLSQARLAVEARPNGYNSAAASAYGQNAVIKPPRPLRVPRVLRPSEARELLGKMYS